MSTASRVDWKGSSMLETNNPLFLLGVLIVALAYSAVGHGGASGYLALTAFTNMPGKDASALALAMNVAVSAIAFTLFRRAKYFDWRISWPLLLGSVPAAYIGGRLPLTDNIHEWVLATVLLYAALVLLIKLPQASDADKSPLRPGSSRRASASGS